MKKTILVAGATGNLGLRIVNALLAQNADVRVLVRKGGDPTKLAHLKKPGITLIEMSPGDKQSLTKACEGVSCVVSALQGLRDVIVDLQLELLNAAVAAGVRQFIPSDFSLNFTHLPAGHNRNFDLRREFHQHLNSANIATTSIFNGAFAEILAYNIPVFDMQTQKVGYWGSNPDWTMDFSTMDDTANFTAAAALDSTAPRELNIASFQISPQMLADLASRLTQSTYTLSPLGSTEQLDAYNKHERAAHPEQESELFPRWQMGQYMHDMFCSHHESLDNHRYPNLKWANAQQVIGNLLNTSHRVTSG